MVDVKRKLDDYGNMVYEVHTDKLTKPLIISKIFGRDTFFRVVVNGQTPDELAGRFTHPDRALELVLEHLRKKKPSPTVKRNRNTEARLAQKKAKANASTSEPDNTEQLHQGPDN